MRNNTLCVRFLLFVGITIVFVVYFYGQQFLPIKMLDSAGNELENVPISKYILTEEDVKKNLNNSDWYLNQILQFSRAILKIRRIENLSPNVVTNTLFSGLVLLTREFPEFNESIILRNLNIQHLRYPLITQCGLAEYQLESYYAHQISRGESDLKDFPYYSNYQLLMSFEVKSLQIYMGRSTFNRIRKIAFIGSGPLPLSSIEILPYLPLRTRIINYDLCPKALELGKDIIRNQNLENRISFIESSAEDIDDLSWADIVYVAALAGQTKQEKQQIMDHLFQIMKPGGILVARSSRGLRTLLYEELGAEDFGNFKQFQVFHPQHTQIINSIVIVRKTNHNYD